MIRLRYCILTLIKKEPIHIPELYIGAEEIDPKSHCQIHWHCDGQGTDILHPCD